MSTSILLSGVSSRSQTPNQSTCACCLDIYKTIHCICFLHENGIESPPMVVVSGDDSSESLTQPTSKCPSLSGLHDNSSISIGDLVIMRLRNGVNLLRLRALQQIVSIQGPANYNLAQNGPKRGRGNSGLVMAEAEGTYIIPPMLVGPSVRRIKCPNLLLSFRDFAAVLVVFDERLEVRKLIRIVLSH